MTVEVDRRVADSDVPPNVPCPGCNVFNWTKIIAPTAPPITKNNDGYPVVLKNFTKKHVTVGGVPQYQMGPEGPVPVMQVSDKVFTSRAQQDSWMKANDYVRTADLYDATVGEDQSIFNRGVPSAPTSEAATMAQEAVFVTEDQLKSIPQNLLAS